MNINAILLGLILSFTMPLFVQCSGNFLQRSELPKEMPDNTMMRFRENGGMAATFKEVSVSGNQIIIKQKTFKERTPRIFYAGISIEEKKALYTTFVENKFDTIMNDERDGIVYDAPSEGIYIRAGRITKNISYGANSPLSGANLRRYQAIKNTIVNLETKYKNDLKQVADNYAVIKYDPEFHDFYFKNAKPLELDDEEYASIHNLIIKAVEKHNSDEPDKRKVWDLSKYNFQYIPVYTEDRQKQVWVNAFCNAFEKDWKKDLIRVKDGGNCYFNLKINLSNSTFYDFSVNGMG